MVRYSRYLSRPLTAVIAGLCCAPLLAQTSGSDSLDRSFSLGADGLKGEWRVTAGAGVGVLPDYVGADSYRALPLPFVDARKGRFFASVLEGVGWEVFRSEHWRVAPAVSYAGGRDDEGALSDFDQVDGGAMAGILITWRDGPWVVDADLGAPVSGDLEGWRARGNLLYRSPVGERWSFAAGPGVSWASEDWNEVLFQVSPEDSARSGIATYQPDGDYLDAHFSGRLSYRLSHRWSVSLMARYTRLLGDAADSPIVDDEGDAHQWFGGALVSYRF